ncbi:protein FAR1-RELATED SEQUENCE 11-like isoform X1 [Amborella trichopoda]|uniref:protein FAR1-RELATED SEQUENCE 11-like isoform X1 n=1 Tax=Amborella trichopoda TaxID=13333 RepID=UPI0009BF6E99|nr:protein FAR1-RELATED SEQUENCE 11-like isoform X1 [Amborella trichopoda]|eukprot:XP_020517438.1 protein FAR1-RELATED SEQUENCE 11-like isoform X1 [Amborella trichopoda]
MIRLFEIERNLKPGELPFIDKDIYNYVCAMNNMNRDNDAHILLTKCKQMKDRDKYFKYAFIVGEDNRLEHIVWSHGSCSRAYEIFSDVVVFDTTYRSNGYYMSFGIWMDVNNHGDTCLFGCVLLRAKRVQSFSWAMKAFVGLMNGKMPQTILTDQDLALKEAIFVIEMRDVVSQRRLMQQKSNNVDVRTMCPFKDHAAHVLTPYAFSKIQEEIISSFQYLTSRKDDGTYEVTLFKKRKRAKSFFDG